jgi:cobalt/nickel transport system permease protein
LRSIDRCAHTNRWRRLPTAEKLVFALAMMLVALFATSWTIQIAVIAAMLALMLLGAAIAWRDVVNAAMVPLGFIAVSTVAQSITVDVAGGWLQLGIASPDTLIHAGFVGLRSVACVIALLFLALTTPLTSILAVMRRLGLGKDIADIALLMFRLIWLLLDCLDAGRQSQTARLGHDGWKRTLRSNGMLLASLLPRALGRADRLNDGLAARGYDGDLRFISIEHPVNRLRMAAAMALVAIMAVLALWTV